MHRCARPCLCVVTVMWWQCPAMHRVPLSISLATPHRGTSPPRSPLQPSAPAPATPFPALPCPPIGTAPSHPVPPPASAAAHPRLPARTGHARHSLRDTAAVPTPTRTTLGITRSSRRRYERCQGESSCVMRANEREWLRVSKCTLRRAHVHRKAKKSASLYTPAVELCAGICDNPAP